MSYSTNRLVRLPTPQHRIGRSARPTDRKREPARVVSTARHVSSFFLDLLVCNVLFAAPVVLLAVPLSADRIYQGLLFVGVLVLTILYFVVLNRFGATPAKRLLGVPVPPREARAERKAEARG